MIANRHHQSHIAGIRRMGWALIALAVCCITIRWTTHLAPPEWVELPVLGELISGDPMGYNLLAGIFALLGTLCLGSVWHKKMYQS